MRNIVWKISELKNIKCYMLRNQPTDITIYYERIQIGQFGHTYELFMNEEMVAILEMKTNRIENFADFHAPDKIGGTDEPSEGQAVGSERADEGES